MDNTQVNTGSGDVVRDIDRDGVKTQVVQLDVGGQFAESLVNPFNPVPVSDVQASEAQGSDQPFYVSIVGDPNGDFAGVNLLEKLVDDSGELSMAVRVVNPPKLDANGATVLSDAPAPIRLVGAVGQFLYIDTTGYQSLHVTSPIVGGMSVSAFSSSNDGANWAAGMGYAIGSLSTAPATTFSAGTSTVIPITAKFLRLTISVVGSAVAYLRNIPAPNPAVIMPQNIAQVGGTATVSGGLNGQLAVGGPVTSGVVALANSAGNPVQVAGIDSGTPGIVPTSGTLRGQAAVRQFLTDNIGRIRLAEEASAINPQNVPSLATQEVGQFEGQSLLELLAQLLLEMRINNQLMFSLPQQIYTAVQSLQLSSSQQSSFAGFSSDEPAAFRADPTIFNQ